jgi:hypothetical protein
VQFLWSGSYLLRRTTNEITSRSYAWWRPSILFSGTFHAVRSYTMTTSPSILSSPPASSPVGAPRRGGLVGQSWRRWLLYEGGLGFVPSYYNIELVGPQEIVMHQNTSRSCISFSWVVCQECVVGIHVCCTGFESGEELP